MLCWSLIIAHQWTNTIIQHPPEISTMQIWSQYSLNSISMWPLQWEEWTCWALTRLSPKLPMLLSYTSVMLIPTRARPIHTWVKPVAHDPFLFCHGWLQMCALLQRTARAYMSQGIREAKHKYAQNIHNHFQNRVVSLVMNTTQCAFTTAAVRRTLLG